MTYTHGVEIKVFKWDPQVLTEKLTENDVVDHVILQKTGQEQKFSVGEGLDGKEVFVLFLALQGYDFFWQTENLTPESEIEVDDREVETDKTSGESRYIVVANWNKGIKVSAVQKY